MTDLAANLRELAEPWSPGDKVKRAIERASHRCGLAYWRTFDIWYGKARRIEPDERAAVAAALEKKRSEDARNEIHELRIRLARLESLLVQRDPDFSRSPAGAVRQSAGGFGGMDRAMDQALKRS